MKEDRFLWSAHRITAVSYTQLFMQSFLFYVIFSPACAVMLNKIMDMTSYKMQAEESMRRIDMILTAEPQAETPLWFAWWCRCYHHNY